MQHTNQYIGFSDTIAAISTPYGTGGIGIIRISGAEAFSIAERIFCGKAAFRNMRSHTVAHGKIIDPDDGHMLDEVLITKMDAPHTYTAEDIAEINCHGGIAVMKNVLSLVLRSGARAAEPGEFTKRAFINGRMDLSQAEAVIDLISSKTDEGTRAAAAQLEGRLSKQIGGARRELIGLIAHIEAAAEYPEYDIDELTGDSICSAVQKIKKELLKTAKGYDKGRLIREGVTAAIIGKPNAGKSSLLNALAGVNKAIVTEIPGTTRDIIEEYVNVEGIPVRFLDTAGIRGTIDPVESIGVEKAKRAAAEAELVIVVLDAQTGILPEDENILSAMAGKRKIDLINKTDIADNEGIAEMKRQLEKTGEISVVVASMQEGTGMEELLTEIGKLLLEGQIDLNNEVLITNARHRQLLINAVQSLESAEKAHMAGLPPDFMTIDIRESAGYLGQITGEAVGDDVVNEIFARFCIGK